MSFTREALAAYEKGAPAAPAVEPEPTPVSAEPAGDETPATDTASSADDGTSDPTDIGDDGSEAVDTASAAEADPDSEVTEDEQAAPAGKTRTVPYDRFQEVVDERNALREFGKYLQAQRTSAPAAEVPAVATPPVVPAAEGKPMPTLEQFDFDPVAHGKALQDWMDERVEQRVDRALQTREQKQTIETVKTNFEARVAEFKKANPGSNYDTVVANPNLPKLAPGTSMTILKSDIGPALIHHLATNPDIATRLARKSAEEQLVELGRIEARITQPAATAQTPKPKAKPVDETNAEPAPQPARTRTVSKAPPPPRALPGGTSTTQRSALDPNLSMDDFVTLERQKKMKLREDRQKIRQRMR